MNSIAVNLEAIQALHDASVENESSVLQAQEVRIRNAAHWILSELAAPCHGEAAAEIGVYPDVWHGMTYLDTLTAAKHLSHLAKTGIPVQAGLLSGSGPLVVTPETDVLQHYQNALQDDQHIYYSYLTHYGPSADDPGFEWVQGHLDDQLMKLATGYELTHEDQHM
jgi:hypothetical protein